MQDCSTFLTHISSHPQVCEAVVASGESLAKRRNFTTKSPLMYEWYQEYYVGAAHGLAGIYYYLMQVRSTWRAGDDSTCFTFLWTRRSIWMALWWYWARQNLLSEAVFCLITYFHFWCFSPSLSENQRDWVFHLCGDLEDLHYTSSFM